MRIFLFDVDHRLIRRSIGCLVYVEASYEGLRTYEKAGFKKVGNIGFDATKYGHASTKFPVDTVSVLTRGVHFQA